MVTAKVFKSGNSQAVRLPKEYRLDADEVSINRIGNVLILLPKNDPWTLFSQGIKEVAEYPMTVAKVPLTKRASMK